jgi:hypothetical protein
MHLFSDPSSVSIFGSSAWKAGCTKDVGPSQDLTFANTSRYYERIGFLLGTKMKFSNAMTRSDWDSKIPANVRWKADEFNVPNSAKDVLTILNKTIITCSSNRRSFTQSALLRLCSWVQKLLQVKMWVVPICTSLGLMWAGGSFIALCSR